ncbi:MAG: sugar O-acetyltransferase [Rhodobacteraceae bacterium]|nr:sugar O-acetyltransferase [Paracoccaceae bacterium]
MEPDPDPASEQSGVAFDTRSKTLLERHHRTRSLLRQYNQSASDDQANRFELLGNLLGTRGPGVWVEPPFYCDYGDNIHLGTGVFLNFNCVFLDGDRIEIGAGTLLGPSVQIYATSHPLRSEDRIYDRDGVPGYHTTADPVKIGRNVWIGGGAIVLPGVSIGDGTTIGAGSVVTKSVPAGVFAAGNPCQVLRTL